MSGLDFCKVSQPPPSLPLQCVLNPASRNPVHWQSLPSELLSTDSPPCSLWTGPFHWPGQPAPSTPHYIYSFISYNSPLCSFISDHIGLLAVAQKPRHSPPQDLCTCHSFAWNALFLDICLGTSLSSFWSLLKVFLPLINAV